MHIHTYNSYGHSDKCSIHRYGSLSESPSQQVAYVMLDNGQKVSWQADLSPLNGSLRWLKTKKPPKVGSAEFWMERMLEVSAIQRLGGS